MGEKKISQPLAWLLFIGLALTWGSSFILMKKGLHSFSYTQIGLIRIAMAWLFTLLIAAPKFKNFKKKHLWALIGVGFFGNGIPYMLFPLAIKHLDSSLVGILNSMVPLFTLIVGLIWFRIPVKWLSVMGIILGFLGAAWLLVPNMQLNVSQLGYGIYPILATLCYGISINIINSRLTDLSSLGITLLSLTVVGPLCLVGLFGTNFIEVMQTDEQAWLNFGFIALLGIVGSSLAIYVFNILIKNTSSLFAASVTYAIPIVALLWGVFDGEEVGLQHLGGMLLILLGVWLINKRGSPAERIKKRLEKKAQANQ